MSDREYIGRLIARALELGLSAELHGGKIILGNTDWRWVAPQLAMTETFLEGYAAGLTDRLAEELRELREVMGKSDQPVNLDLALGIKPDRESN